MTPIRRRARAALERGIAARTETFDAARLAASAIVFAPHADDETLGCGGTIAKKVAAGANVQVVVMTDGGGARTGADREELAATRRAEALRAAAALGLEAGAVRFLEFEDGGLARAGGALPDAVASLLAARPRQVFVPYRDDGHPDHEAAFRTVVASARAIGLACEVYEYPIWAWRHWPWVPLRPPFGDELPPWLASTKFLGGRRFARTFRHGSAVREQLAAKKAALDCYVSQMSRPMGTPEPWALDQVSGGEFLGRFLQDYELFRARRMHGEG